MIKFTKHTDIQVTTQVKGPITAKAHKRESDDSKQITKEQMKERTKDGRKRTKEKGRTKDGRKRKNKYTYLQRPTGSCCHLLFKPGGTTFAGSMLHHLSPRCPISGSGGGCCCSATPGSTFTSSTCSWSCC